MMLAVTLLNTLGCRTWTRMKRVWRRWLHAASRLVRHARYLELRFSREHARVRICWALRYDTS